MNEILNVNGVECYEKDGTAYLKLETVARGLGFTQEKNGVVYVRWETVNNLLEHIGFPNKLGKACFIPKNIFYRLAMKAKNETAEKFQAVVADEIIPSIRKHGAYMTPETIEAALLNPDTLIKLATTLKQEQAARQALERKVELDKPKVLFADAMSVASTSILVGELAKLIKQNGVEIGQNHLFVWLRENGYLVKRKGNDYNLPTQYAMERGWFEIKETCVTHAGHTTISRTPKVTGKGQIYFVEKFLRESATASS